MGGRANQVGGELSVNVGNRPQFDAGYFFWSTAFIHMNMCRAGAHDCFPLIHDRRQCHDIRTGSVKYGIDANWPAKEGGHAFI